MRTLLLAFVLLAPSARGATITLENLQRPEGLRQYWLAQPDAAPQGRRPLVLVVHGHGASGRIALGMHKAFNDPAAAWLDVAAREHLIVIAPEGWKASDGKQAWNDCRADAETNPQTDDVAFLREIVEKAVATHNADPERVYVTGASNGGGMVYRLAIELPHTFAAYAASNALMPAKSLCPAPSQPVSMLIQHGTADKISPYAGGEVGHWMLHGRGSGLPVEDGVRFWRELGKLNGAPATTVFPHRDKNDPTRATRYLWGADPAGTQVEFLKVEGGGHVQPSISKPISWLAEKLVGEQNRDVEYAEETWQFFKNKRMAATR